MYRNDIEGYWDAYKEVQTKIFDEMKPEASPDSYKRPQLALEDYPHFRCVYCKQNFDTLEEVLAHYTRNQVSPDAAIISASRVGYSETSWRRGQKIINAPTIRSVVG